ncbi:MAG: hypothetical protein ACK5MT_20295 [Actinomycetales bacterium]
MSVKVRARPGRAPSPDPAPGLARTTPLTVISQISHGWTPFVRAVLTVVPQTPWGKSQELQDLSFIQAARWAVIPGLPGERLRHDYLLFESNYNGPLDAYLEAFADILTTRMRLIWNSTPNFPNYPEDARRSRMCRLTRPIPGRDFVNFVGAASVEADHYYAALPHASNTEILQALAVRDALSGIADLGDSPDPDAVRAAWRSAVHALSCRPVPAKQPGGTDPDVSGGKYALTLMSPIRDGRVSQLRQVLADLGSGTHSPFARMPGVHFARWVVLDPPCREPDRWRHPYLLTTTTSDTIAGAGDQAEAAIRALYRGLGAARERVFEHCLGYPVQAGEDEFLWYLSPQRIPTSRFYCGYPEADVATVRSALAQAIRLTDFARAHALDAPEALLPAFTEEFGR